MKHKPFYFLLLYLPAIALADTCPSTYPVLTGGQCCTSTTSTSACLTCGPSTPVCVAPTPSSPTAQTPSKATVKYVPIPIDDGVSAIIPAEKNLPKDPGAAGDATIAGVITNPYGVRDDVMRAIVYAYPNNPKAQAGLFNIAKNYQAILTNNTTASTIINNVAEANAWNRCVTSSTGDRSAFDNVLRPILLDTYDRSMAYATALQTIEGVVTLPSVTVQCP